MQYKIIEHTADLAIEIQSKSSIELFADVGMVLFDLAAGLSTIEEKDSLTIEVKSIDKLSNLVDWSSELLYRLYAEGWLFKRFDILEKGADYIKAIAYGEKLDEKRHRLKIEIKACTYHNLDIVKNDNGCVATLTFDI